MSQLSLVKSADRALELLELFDSRIDGLTFSEVCHVTGWPKSSSLALLRTLEQRHFLDTSDKDGKYRLGPRVASLGMTYLNSLNIAREGAEVVRSVSRACDETVHLGALRGSEVLYVAKEEGGGQMRMLSSIGRTVPAHGTGVGKVLLAALSLDELDTVYPAGSDMPALTATTITSRDTFLKVLDRVRRVGYATDNGESTIGVKCIAAPVLDVEAKVIAAMSVSVPEPRFTEDRVPILFSHLVAGIQRLSLRMGCPPDQLPRPVFVDESMVGDGCH
jgi:DNA-binding IclR family transcriptional regulator